MNKQQILLRVLICAAILIFFINPLFIAFTFNSPVHLKLTMLVGLLFAGYIAFLCIRTKKMKEKLGVSTDEEFNELKERSDHRYKNRYFLTNGWLINTLTMRTYPVSEITKVSTSETHNIKTGTHRYIQLTLKNGIDVIRIDNSDVRDDFADAIRAYTANGGRPLSPAKPKNARQELQKALKELTEKNKGDRR